MRTKILMSAVLLASAVASSSALANLITNGGFESPVVTAGVGYEYRYSGDTDWGWTSGARGAVQFNSAYGQTIGAEEQSVQLEVTGDFISQVISTTAGQEYTLSFLLASYVPPGDDTLQVFIDATSYDFSGTSDWISHAIQFTASSASTLIKFVNNDALPNPPYTYPHLDDVSVVAVVPVPPTMALVGIALAALVWTRRKLA